MRIALFTDGIHPFVIGGMQKHSFYLAKYFALNKIEVDLYHTAADIRQIQKLNCFSEDEAAYITSIPVEYPVAGTFPGHYVREMYEYSLRLAKELKHRPVDFVYVQGLCGMYMLEHKNEFSTPVGINFHGLEMFQKPANMRSRLEQVFFRGPVLRSMRNADLVFSLGGKLTDIIRNKGVSEQKISEIAIGLDSSWPRTLPLETAKIRKFVFVGRYERRKGIEELSAVITGLLTNEEFIFEFIGAIPKEKQIISDNVVYHGSVSDAAEIKRTLMGADVLVCPSYSEGMPTVILEAMASGLAVIASDVGAVSEQVSNQNGILIAPGNKEALKDAILKMIGLPEEQLRSMKNASLEKLKEHFLWENIIKKTIDRIKLAIRI